MLDDFNDLTGTFYTGNQDILIKRHYLLRMGYKLYQEKKLYVF